MKTTFLTCFCSAAFLVSAFAQEPPVPPDPAPDEPALEAPATAPTPAPAPPAPAAATPPATAPTITPAADDDSLERRIERKVKRGVSITINDDPKRDRREERRERRRERRADRGFDVDSGAALAIPIVAIVFLALFGAPVLIVAVIMFFSYIKARSLHKTVRMMVEKGQPVPEALFATPHSPAKQRSDMRRGVVLLAVGLGVMLFFAAASDGGAWAMGLIPFLIGAGYLAIWQLETRKLDTHKAGTDNPPPLP
jgi:Flp pilus assembly protein TadB